MKSESIRQLMPRWVKRIMRRVYDLPLGIVELLLSRRDDLTPPRRLRYGRRLDEFKRGGVEFLQYFIELGNLKPNENVLDVGCGSGRLAIQLAEYLGGEGSYEGFDIVSDAIHWCRRKITPKYPNFHFQLADIYNQYYNPKGNYVASNYRFPYENESFDFAFLISVFTHMRPQDTENYLSEIARVLRKGGRCLITFFLLNMESLKLVDARLSTLDFKYGGEGYRTTIERTPESAVAYHEEFIRSLCENHGMHIVEPIHYGSWCGRKKFLSYQDIVIAVRK